MTPPAPPLGPDPRVASVLAYLAWWVSGAVVWLVERDRPVVRFHAMQSMLAFGTAFLAWATLWGGSFAVLVISAAGFFLLQRLAQVRAAGRVHRVGRLPLAGRRAVSTSGLPFFGRTRRAPSGLA